VPLPRALARFNRVVTNRVIGVLANRVRPFATLVHTGRRTGRPHRTTLMAFEQDGLIAIALTYGRDVDWAHNLLAAGGAELELGGRTLALSHPRLTGDAGGRHLMPPVVQAGLSVIGVHEYLLAEGAEVSPTSSSDGG
jgi:deazaflavin-dependent oxidoreductase (nitroreductase family)